MRFRLFAPVVWSLACVAAQSMCAAVEFSGYMKADGETKFRLSDPAVGTVSAWLTVGGNFDGYRVAAFDAPTETLSVEKAGVMTALPLNSVPPTAQLQRVAQVRRQFEAEKRISAVQEEKARERLAVRQAELEALHEMARRGLAVRNMIARLRDAEFGVALAKRQVELMQKQAARSEELHLKVLAPLTTPQ